MRPKPEKAFVVEMIGCKLLRFIEPTEMRKAFVIANSVEEATRFETAEQATIRARIELTPSTFNVREACSAGGWHLVAGPKPVPVRPDQSWRRRPRGKYKPRVKKEEAAR